MNEWIKNEGKQPVDDAVIVEVALKSSDTEMGYAKDFRWDRCGRLTDIQLYRIVNQSKATTTAPDILAANDIQISGTHYKSKAIQPWDYIASNGLGFFEGNIVKYVTRWKDKGGVDDLKKAQHYLQKLIEIQQ